MTLASGVGSMPGGQAMAESDNAREYAEAVRVVLGELPELPHVPELPGRGAIATMTGRALGIVTELGADLQPHGWRLTDASGIDHRRARSLVAQDLDEVEEQARGHNGVFKIQVAGPWTLAATVEKRRGDKVLSDHGARRELAEALAEGLRDHVADVRRRLPEVSELLVQLDEPALAAVLAGQVPTASGFGRHRTIHPPEASGALAGCVTAIEDAGGIPIVHSCAADVPVELLRGAGFRGLSIDLETLAASAYEGVAAALEAGERVLLGVLPSIDPGTVPTEKALGERVLRFLDMLGLDLEQVSGQLVVTPSCGLAGATPAWSRQALGLSRSVARSLSG